MFTTWLQYEAGYELSGFVWFQGWNDMVAGSVYPNRGQPGSYDSYSKFHALHHVMFSVRTQRLPDLRFRDWGVGRGWTSC